MTKSGETPSTSAKNAFAGDVFQDWLESSRARLPKVTSRDVFCRWENDGGSAQQAISIGEKNVRYIL